MTTRTPAARKRSASRYASGAWAVKVEMATNCSSDDAVVSSFSDDAVVSSFSDDAVVSSACTDADSSSTESTSWYETSCSAGVIAASVSRPRLGRLATVRLRSTKPGSVRPSRSSSGSQARTPDIARKAILKIPLRGGRASTSSAPPSSRAVTGTKKRFRSGFLHAERKHTIGIATAPTIHAQPARRPAAPASLHAARLSAKNRFSSPVPKKLTCPSRTIRRGQVP